MHTVLVLGGYGFFGARIAEGLASDEAIRLLVAGRDAREAAAVAARLRLSPEQSVHLDANDPELARRLGELGVATLINTAGPFQSQRYTVARAAIQAGCRYIDLADGREFVMGIEKLDALARERGVTVVSGASSVPALSSAVVDRYLPQFARLDAIEFGISTGARTPGLGSWSLHTVRSRHRTRPQAGQRRGAACWCHAMHGPVECGRLSGAVA
jgi:saccharopine dehydrogenase-like NADP-dependent oxidoreductase